MLPIGVVWIAYLHSVLSTRIQWAWTWGVSTKVFVQLSSSSFLCKIAQRPQWHTPRWLVRSSKAACDSLLAFDHLNRLLTLGSVTHGKLLAYPNMCKHDFSGGCTVNFCRLCDFSRQKNDGHDDRLLEDKEPNSLAPTSISIAHIQILFVRHNASTYIIHSQLSTLVQSLLPLFRRLLNVITQQ